MDFSNKLKEQRTKHKLSQEQLADKLHIARQSISKWERGEAYPSIGMLLQVSELFDVPVDDLLKGDEYLKNKIVKDGENLKHPRLKSFFEWVFLTGAAILLVRLTIGGLAHFGVVDWGVEFLGGWLPSLIPLMLMVGGAIAAEELGKIKQK
jgi:transcriptional regulator with XRE-family HTH domain